MHPYIPTSDSEHFRLNNVMLLEIYSNVRSTVSRYVNSSTITAWQAQKQDIIDDIVQDVVIRVVAYIEHTTLSIHSIQAISRTIAKNYCHDLWRKEIRRVQLHRDDLMSLQNNVGADTISRLEDVVFLNMQDYSLTKEIAAIIATFPTKQRSALLIEIARKLDELDDVAQIQQIFQVAGIDLRSYQQPIPISQAERSRHAALLSLARKRLRQAMYTRLQELRLTM